MGDVSIREQGGWPSGASSDAADLCSRLIYTSRATWDFDGPNLSELVEAAQARNALEDVTGCLVYDDGRFLQWLEGPSQGIDRIATSIRMDERHTDIQVLDQQASEPRVFSDWTMRLLVGGGVDNARGAVPAPNALIEKVHGRHEPIFGLAQLLGSPQSPHVAPSLPGGSAPGAALPHAYSERLEADAATVIAIANDALKGDVDRVYHALSGSIGERRLAARTVANLLGAVMECIRVGWLSDDVAEYEATIAHCTALTAFRRVAIAAFHHPIPMRNSALVATPPCEPHLLQTAMASEVFAEVGFATTCDHPETADELDHLIRSTAPRLVVLCMSGLFQRDERLTELAATVLRARSAAGQHPTTLAVLGRSFSDCLDGPHMEGTACACRSAPALVRHLYAIDPSATGLTQQLPIPASGLPRVATSVV